MRRNIGWFACFLACAPLLAQTTQGIITGQVKHAADGTPIRGARISYFDSIHGEVGGALSDSNGFYTVAYLAPGVYRLRADFDGYRARELQGVELAVGGRLEVNFPMWLLGEDAGDTERNQPILPILGPDLEMGRASSLDLLAASSETRHSALSYVIDPRVIAEVPLSARNTYSMLFTLPGFTATQTTGRGLQFSADGQRPSASNYLLDGVENNDYLNTGPFTPTPPEAIQEYRVSTNNDSAEYRNPGGFVANAVTRQGTAAYHGDGYGYLGNDVLNANTFQNNASPFGLPRQPFKQFYGGYWLGGPIVRQILFFSSSLEQFRSRSRLSPSTAVAVPTQIRQCAGAGANTSSAVRLFDRFPLVTEGFPVYEDPDPCLATGRVIKTAPVFVDRTFLLERLDYRSRSGRNRLTGTVLVTDTSQPQHYSSPYVGMTAPLSRDSTGVSISYVRLLKPDLFNEIRAKWRGAKLASIPPHPDVPFLQLDNTGRGSAIYPYTLPSQQEGVQFGMKENTGELGETLLFAHGRQAITAGASLLLRRPRYLLGFLGSGLYNFNDTNQDLQLLALGQAVYYQLPVSTAALQQGNFVPWTPSYDHFSNNQFSFFGQDNIRLHPRVALNVGLRYESLGTLQNDTNPAGFFQAGPGSNFAERIASANPTLEFARRGVYRPDRNNWAGRLGISYNPSARLVLRTGYGIFYDRSYDNLFLTQRNSFRIESFCYDRNCTPRQVDVTQPITTIAPGSEQLARGQILPWEYLRSPADWVGDHDQVDPLWVDENLRTPYVQNWSASALYRFSPAFSLELSHMGSAARKLISNDIVNRTCSVTCRPGVDSTRNAPGFADPGRLNNALPEILYRSNSGGSSYAAMSATAHYRSRAAQFQAAYTWSHSIDNQSDPLLGDLFNLASTNLDAIGQARGFGTFTRQFDSRADRGNSDFDIRHSLVVYSIWFLPQPARRAWRRIAGSWRVAGLAGVQSGLPFTVYATQAYTPSSKSLALDGGGFLIGQRRNVTGEAMLSEPQAFPGGVRLVNNSALPQPSVTSSKLGTLGRNALRAPHVWNVDLSLARSFDLASVREGASIEFRADATNAFNHANLSPPDLAGNALYGANQNQASFPAAVPLFPSPRRVQLQLKVHF